MKRLYDGVAHQRYSITGCDLQNIDTPGFANRRRSQFCIVIAEAEGCCEPGGACKFTTCTKTSYVVHLSPILESRSKAKLQSQLEESFTLLWSTPPTNTKRKPPVCTPTVNTCSPVYPNTYSNSLFGRMNSSSSSLHQASFQSCHSSNIIRRQSTLW